eukprot:jgi/Pico_ML_1/54961/g93.t1
MAAHQTHVNEVQRAVNDRDGRKLAQLMDLQDDTMRRTMANVPIGSTTGGLQSIGKNLQETFVLLYEAAQVLQEKTNNMADAGAQMMKCFAVSIQAQHNRNKKLAALFIVNELFKVYFKLNTLHLCKNLVRAVMAPTFAKLEEFPMAQRVTYMYYVGRGQ